MTNRKTAPTFARDDMHKLKLIYALNVGTIAALVIAQIAIVPVLLHYIGVDGYEQWMFLLSVTATVNILDLGWIVYNSNLTRLRHSAGESAEVQKSVSYGLFFFVYMLALFSLAATIIYISSLSQSPYALALMLLSVPFTQLRTWLSYTLTARLNQAWELGTFVVYTLLQATAFAVTVIFGGNVDDLALVNLLVPIIVGIPPLVYLFNKYAPDVRLRPRFIPWPYLKATFKECLSNFGYSAASILGLHVPVILLGILPGIPTGCLAVFTTSRTLTGVVRQFCQQLSRSNSIEISRHLAPAEKGSMHRLFLTGAAITSAIAAIGVGGLLPVSNLVLTLWTGKPELYNELVLTLFCLALFLSAQIQLPMMLPQYINRANLMTKPILQQIALVLVFGLVMGYYWNAPGMVIAISIAELSTVGFMAMRKVLPLLDITPYRFLKASLLPGLALFALSFAASSLGRWVMDPHNIKQLVLTGCIWSALMLPVFVIIYRMAKRRFRPQSL